jgi:hypothetical protein
MYRFEMELGFFLLSSRFDPRFWVRSYSPTFVSFRNCYISRYGSLEGMLEVPFMSLVGMWIVFKDLYLWDSSG